METSPIELPVTETLTQLRRRLVSFGAARTRPDVAEDLAQETLMLLATKYPSVTGLGDLVPLAIKIMRFKLMSQRRKAHRRGEDFAVDVSDVDLRDETASPHTLAERRQMAEILRRALTKLDGRCNELFRHKLEGRTFVEIKTLMGASAINTVYTWEHRCSKRLRDIVGRTWQTEVQP